MSYGRFQFRRGTAAEWAAANPILADGEVGVERDTRQFKIGDGTKAWNALAYGGFVGPQGAQGPAGPIGPEGPEGGFTDLAWDPTTNSVTSSNGTDATIPVADETTTGLLSDDDKRKLDSLTGYVHTQPFAQTLWTINHNLNRYPSVTIVDSAGSVVIGGVQYIDPDTIEVSFSAGFSGKAYLS